MFKFRLFYFTGSTNENTNRLGTSVNFKVSNGTSLYQTEDQVFPADGNKHEDSTLTYLPTDIDLFKNSFVINLVQVVVSLVGVFVFFFAACVVTYIYFKCFRQTTDCKRLNSNQCESEYKSLSFGAVEYESPLHPEPEQQVNLELTYLTPVFRSTEKRETSPLAENDIIEDTPIQKCMISSQSTESKSATDNTQNYVYIEIIEDNIERSTADDDPAGESLCMKNSLKYP